MKYYAIIIVLDREVTFDLISKIWKTSFLLSIIGIIILIGVYIFVNNVTFKLKGSNNIELELNETYSDEGFIAQVFKWDISNKVKTDNNLNNSIVGNYKTNYKLSFLGKNYYLVRNIKVIDKTIPTIKLNGKDEIKIYVGEKYNDEGASANDNYDGDISQLIEVENNLNTEQEGNYQIIYSIKDSSGNSNSIIRNIIVEKKKVINKIENKNESYDKNDPIIKYVKENNYSVSIGYYNLVTGEKYLYQENKVYYGASLIKTLDAIYLYDKGLVNDSIRPYIDKAISVSDNDSHHYLVNYIGRTNLKNYGVSLGAYNTLSGDGYYGNTTVKDQIIYLKKLYAISKENDELKSYFINDYGNYLKINSNDVMHKYGYYGQYYHDVGIVLDNEPYIVVILTNHGNDNKKEIINNLSNLMYKYHKKQL